MGSVTPRRQAIFGCALVAAAFLAGGCAGETGTTGDESPEIPATVLGTQVEAPAPTLGQPVSTFRDEDS